MIRHRSLVVLVILIILDVSFSSDNVENIFADSHSINPESFESVNLAETGSTYPE